MGIKPKKKKFKQKEQGFAAVCLRCLVCHKVMVVARARRSWVAKQPCSAYPPTVGARGGISEKTPWIRPKCNSCAKPPECKRMNTRVRKESKNSKVETMPASKYAIAESVCIHQVL